MKEQAFKNRKNKYKQEEKNYEVWMVLIMLMFVIQN